MEQWYENVAAVQGTVHNIVREAVELEHEFCCSALPVSLVGMNAGLMGQYIEYVADRLLVELQCERLYNTPNPFDWMEMISLQVCHPHSLPFRPSSKAPLYFTDHWMGMSWPLHLCRVCISLQEAARVQPGGVVQGARVSHT